jgi:hypothetical protein
MRRFWRNSIGLLLGACAFAQPPTTVDVSGSVTNSLTGEPVPKAHVTLERQPGSRYGAISTAEGKFAIAGLPPGTYYATVERTGYLQAIGASGSTMELSEWKAGPAKLDLKLAPQAVISGRVLNAKGEPMENVRVVAWRGVNTRSAETNRRGEFRIPALRAGRYVLRADPQALNAPPEIRSDATEEVAYGAANVPSPMEVRAGTELRGVEIRLEPAKIVRVSGFITGMPSGCQDYVLLHRWGPDFRDGMTNSMLTNARFAIWRWPPGRHRLSAWCRTAAGRVLTAPVELDVGGSNIDNVELAFTAPFELKGQVEGELPPPNGGPPRAIKLVPAGPRGESLPSAEIGLDGTFQVPRVQPDRYRVTVSRLPGNWYVKEPGPILDLTRGAPGAAIKVTLAKATADVSGTVEHAKGVVANAMVGLAPDAPYGADFIQGIETASDGKYSFPTVPPGKYRLFVFDRADWDSLRNGVGLDWYTRDAERLEIADGETVTRNLKLPVWDNR